VIIDASHRRWIVVCLVLLAIATIAYIHYRLAAIDGPRGNSWLGLVYGVVGLALMIYAGAWVFVAKFLPGASDEPQRG